MISINRNGCYLLIPVFELPKFSFPEDAMPKPITPLLAADVIIELKDFPDRPIVLIERANL